jgi:uncharacterized protein (TIGR02246 family)
MRHITLCIALLSCIACSPKDRRGENSASSDGDPAVDSASSLAGLDSTERSFLAAYNRKDVEGILANYTNDIRFVLEGKVFEGKEAIRKPWERSLQTLSGLKFTPITRTTSGDQAVLLESFTQQYREPGKPAQTDSGYSLAIVRRQPDGRWLYQTVMLSRPPEKASTRAQGK